MINHAYIFYNPFTDKVYFNKWRDNVKFNSGIRGLVITKHVSYDYRYECRRTVRSGGIPVSYRFI